MSANCEECEIGPKYGKIEQGPGPQCNPSSVTMKILEDGVGELGLHQNDKEKIRYYTRVIEVEAEKAKLAENELPLGFLMEAGFR